MTRPPGDLYGRQAGVLVALYLEPGARTPKRRERAAALGESPAVDPAVLDDLLRRFGMGP